MRNYRPAFSDDTSNVRTSTFKDHADTDMHKYAMVLFKKVQSSGPCEYTPIARALAQSPTDAASTKGDKTKVRNGVRDSQGEVHICKNEARL